MMSFSSYVGRSRWSDSQVLPFVFFLSSSVRVSRFQVVGPFSSRPLHPPQIVAKSKLHTEKNPRISI